MNIFDLPISMSTVGAGIGLMLGPAGVIAGSMLGGIADTMLGGFSKKSARRKAKRKFLQLLLKRYNTQVFASALERLGSAMIYAQELGLKPGTPEFEAYIVRKVGREIGYRGSCTINLQGPTEPGGSDQPIATIDHTGNMTAHTPNIDPALGQKWIEACRELHKAALQSWAEDRKTDILLQRDIAKQRAEATSNNITRVMVNGGIIMLILGYSVRQKYKLKAIRQGDKSEAR